MESRDKSRFAALCQFKMSRTMPELAEVELGRRIWDAGMGSPLLQVRTHPKARLFRDTPASDFEVLQGLSIISSTRHGKRLYFSLKEDLHLEVHLGMSGKMTIAPSEYEPQKHDHFVLYTRDTALILNDYRMFGKVVLHHTTPPWYALPPDPLDPSFTLDYLKKLKAKKPQLGLKTALLRQELFPGIGNWMADEICWGMRAHPARKLARVAASALYQAVLDVSKGAVQYVTEGNLSSQSHSQLGFSAGQYVAQVPPKEWLFQHRWKKGGTCPRCKASLQRGTIASRTTAWCASCQPL